MCKELTKSLLKDNIMPHIGNVLNNNMDINFELKKGKQIINCQIIVIEKLYDSILVWVKIKDQFQILATEYLQTYIIDLVKEEYKFTLYNNKVSYEIECNFAGFYNTHDNFSPLRGIGKEIHLFANSLKEDEMTICLLISKEHNIKYKEI